MKKNLIVLKNLKYHDDMSEETLCFSADVWIDGYKAGYATNGGYGGPTDVRPYDAKGKELIKFVTTQIEQMPPEVIEFMGKTLTMRSTLDTFVDEIVDNMLKEKEEKKVTNWIKKKLPTGIVAKDGDNLYYYPFNSITLTAHKQELAKRVLKARPTCEILNKF